MREYVAPAERKHKVVFITIVPSPYQRDLFQALAVRPDVDLSVCYMESASPDSPWPEKELRSFERIMPGFWVPFGEARGHVNWSLPDVSQADFVILSTLTSFTGQWLMRAALRKKRWLFWGERLRVNTGVKELIQRFLASPVADASGIVGIGRAAEEDYRRRFPNLPHFCIPYHCDVSDFLKVPRVTEASRPVTFLFCGQMIMRKGVDLLLGAFDRLVAKGIDARLLLVGREAELPRFLELVSPATRARISFEGFQPPERLPEYFAKADIFVLPSRHDGWGVVVNQAMAAGLPVITSDEVGAGLDFVETGVNGFCVAAGQSDPLLRAMEALATNREMAQKWGATSRTRARNLLPEVGAEKWARIFDQISPRASETGVPN